MLTKADIRKYIWDFITLSYLFGDCHWNCHRLCNCNGDKSPRDGDKTNDNIGAKSTTVTDTTTASSAVNTSGIDLDIDGDGDENENEDVEGGDGGDGCCDDYDDDEDALCISVLGFSEAFRQAPGVKRKSDTNRTRSTLNESNV